MKMVLQLAVALTAILFLANPTSCEMDVTIEYAAPVSLTCDSNALNVSDHMVDIRRLYWILSDGSLVDSSSTTPSGIVLSSNNYTLNMTKVTDDLFGYYHCVILYNSTTVKVVRKGLNINGPDYSKLYEEYRRSALIGGIAAAVMLAVLGLGCIVYHFRFQKDQDELEDRYKMGNNSTIQEATYDNHAMEMEAKVTPEQDGVNDVIDEKL